MPSNFQSGADVWQTVFTNYDGVDSAISSSQPDTRWALAGQHLAIYQTASGSGGRVSLLPAGNGINLTGAAFGSRLEKCPANDDVFIAGTDNLWRTTDFFSAPLLPGPTWHANGPEMGACVQTNLDEARGVPDAAGCITALAFAASDTTCSTYAFATGDGRLRRTVNGGTTWDDLDASHAIPDRFVTDLAFAPTDANILYVTLSGFDEGTPGQPGHVFKTTSALAAVPAWSDVSPPVNQPQNTIAVDPVDSQVVYVGADTGVWQSRDGAATWTHMGPESGMPNVAVFDLEIHPTVRRPFDLVSGRCLAGVVPPTPSPTPSATPTLMATPTVAPASCVGDCDGKGSVTTRKHRCARRALRAAPKVDVALIVQAVNHALNGCGGG